MFDAGYLSMNHKVGQASRLPCAYHKVGRPSRLPSASARASRDACPTLPWLAAWLLLLLTATLAPAQEALRQSLAGDAVAEANARRQLELPYTIKQGDFRLLLTPGIEQDWNDNINVSSTAPLSDFILQPMLGIGMSYPVTSRNVLRLDATVGYDIYYEHPQYDSPLILAGSILSFDTYVKDFVFNVHDRFQFTQDPASAASTANIARYGGLDNFAGLNVTWDLEDVVLTLNYDHENFVSSTSQYEYLNRAAELLVGRAGFRLHPALTAGLEATGDFTSYAQTQTMSDFDGYSAGVYGSWHPGHYTEVQLRGGYTEYFYQQTAQTIQGLTSDTYYLGLTANHDISAAISYWLGAGHELVPGIQAQSVEDWYLRAGLNWKILKDLSLNTSIGYEYGTQLLLTQPPSSETFDWGTVGFGASYNVTKHLLLSLTYRFTDRTANLNYRGYTQNFVGLRLSYLMQ